MLKKLLKYDFKAVFKFWWIAALSSLVLSIIGGGCITVLKTERELPGVVNASAGTLLFLSIISIFVFVTLTTILIFVRFYRNFFTDEGYLTFTLPVKTSSLLKSKLIMAVTTTVLTLIMVALDIFTMLGIGFFEEIFTKENWEYLLTLIDSLFEELGIHLVIYALEGIVLVILMLAFSHLFLFSCITLASVITKKARVITGIGIYYGVNSIISFVMQLFLMFGMQGLIQRISALNGTAIYYVFDLVLLGIIAFAFTVCALLYTLQYWMLDRKLNLS